MSEEAFDELIANLHCMYDITVKKALEITGLSKETFMNGRAKSGTVRWPFNDVKCGAFKLDWVDIFNARVEAIRTVSPKLRQILFEVEKYARICRVLYAPASKVAYIKECPFPNEDEFSDNGGAVVAVTYATKVCHQRSKKRRGSARTGVPKLSNTQIKELIPFAQDLPITILATLCRCSHHTIRKADPEFFGNKKGKVTIYGDQVEFERAKKMSTLDPESIQARVLSSVAEAVETRKWVLTKLVNKEEAKAEASEEDDEEKSDDTASEEGEEADEQETGSIQEEEEDVAAALQTEESQLFSPYEMSHEDMVDMFGFLIEDTPPPSYDDRSEEDRFWDNVRLTPEEQKMWESLQDLPMECFS